MGMLKGKGSLSAKYTLALSARVRVKVSQSVALLSDPLVEPYLNLHDIESLARYLASNRIFREAFCSMLAGPPLLRSKPGSAPSLIGKGPMPPWERALVDGLASAKADLKGRAVKKVRKSKRSPKRSRSRRSLKG